MRKSLVSYTGILSTLFVLATMLLGASCTQQDEYTSAVGYLYAPTLDMDLTVEDLLETRAVKLADVPIDEASGVVFPTDASGVTFVVKDKDGKEKYNGLGLWTKPLALPVGSYTITATYGTNTFGAPHFTGFTTGTITALSKEEPSIDMTLGNALVRVQLDTELKKHFTPTTLSFSQGTEKASYEYKEDQWYYIPSNKDGNISLSLSGTNEAEVDATFNYDITTPAAKTAYAITCNQNTSNWPTITLPEQQAGAWAGRLYVNVTPATVSGNISDENKNKLVYEASTSETDWSEAKTATQIQGNYYYFNGLTKSTTYYVRARIGNITSNAKLLTAEEGLSGITVSSAHYNDVDGNLAGTNATLTVDIPEGIIKTLMDNGLLQITGYELENSDGDIVRTATAAGIMTQSSGWPYLPKGSGYTLTINHKLSSETSTIASKNTVTKEVPAPTFSVNLTSYSSYDKYLDNEKDEANAMDAFTIKSLGASWTISADLIGNDNYTKSFSYNNNGSTSSPTMSGTSYNAGDKASLAVGTQYKVSASVTFDGKTINTDEKTHYITGLPYRGDLSVANKGKNWTETAEKNSSVTFENNSVKLQASRTGFGNVHAMITSKQSFILPNKININFINVVTRTGSLADYNYAIRFGGTDIKISTSSVNLNENHLIGANTYQVILDSYYWSSNLYSYFIVSKIEVLYGPYSQ